MTCETVKVICDCILTAITIICLFLTIVFGIPYMWK